MPYDWGPHYIVPSQILKAYSGDVQLRGVFDKELLLKEPEELGLSVHITRVTNP